MRQRMRPSAKNRIICFTAARLQDLYKALRQGYHHATLNPATRQVATFSTPWGNYKSKRLVFGAKASQDVLHETMLSIFGDIPHCLNQRDDILLGGRDDAEHIGLHDSLSASKR